MKYQVVKAHAPDPGDVLVVAKGSWLRWERRPTSWQGWLYCENASGVRGWVPESWLTLESGEAKIERDYDANELEVSVGVVLDEHLSESGWLLARDESGRHGWVPLECVRALT